MVLDYARPDPRPSTLLERLTGAGFGAERAEAMIRAGDIEAGGEVVTDPSASVPFPTAWFRRSSS